MVTINLPVRASDVEGGHAGANWADFGFNIDMDPIFRSAALGDLRVTRYSPVIDMAMNGRIELDRTDVDDDPNSGPRIPWDFVKLPRVFDYLPDPNVPDPNAVDMGAYELPELTCPLDINEDGSINLPDLAIILGCFGAEAECAGTSSPACCCCWADFNCDGFVTLFELSSLLAEFGSDCDGEGFTGGGRDAPPSGEGGEGDSGGDPDNDPFVQWLRSRTVDELLDWYRDGMPR